MTTIRSSPSSSRCSNSSSSSSYSLASTSLSNRLETIFKKASELCTLCDIEACVIYYGPDGELKTWPKEREKVRDIALRFNQLNEALRHKKSVNLHGFLNKKKKNKGLKNPNKKKKTSLKNLNVLKYPLADHYSPDQVSQLTQSLELNVSKFQERLRFLESQKQNETKPDHQSLTSISSLNQSLNPSQFSLFMYNHGYNTLSQIPVSASNFNQDYISALLEQSELKSQIMKQEVCGYEQNMCMSNHGDATLSQIPFSASNFNQDFSANNNFQHSFVSNTQDYYSVQKSVNNNYGLKNQLMKHDLCGYEHNMCMSNHGDATFSQIPLSASNFNQDFSVSIQEESGLMQQELCGYDQNQNMSMGDITNNNFQVTCASVLESVNNFGLNQLMHKEFYGCHQNMSMGNINNNSFQHPWVSNADHTRRYKNL
ncbi:putative transcription factor MADS-type1 family [Arabidopsis thaliana]|uniref:Transcription factor MADS-box n=1 Tax=Arabidopsis thaliana x Arabidopsis arenosa TaxID=1240361 RepID=A0A8T2CVC3_9BRAS|nr:Transcription factor MADS-box [Arabidopsis thaliana x Arabidopsis arenosa]